MYETEIKILEIDRKEVEAKLLSIGAKKIFDDEICAIYYDSAYDAIKKTRSVFRLRKEGARAVLTYKKPVADTRAKVKEEKEVEVSDFLTMKAILESAGFSSWLEMRKHRTTYELGDVHFEIDKYHDEFEYIPEFLEIEGKDVETVYRHAKILGFGKDDCKPWDAIETASYYSGLIKK